DQAKHHVAAVDRAGFGRYVDRLYCTGIRGGGASREEILSAIARSGIGWLGKIACGPSGAILDGSEFSYRRPAGDRQRFLVRRGAHSRFGVAVDDQIGSEDRTSGDFPCNRSRRRRRDRNLVEQWAKIVAFGIQAVKLDRRSLVAGRECPSFVCPIRI